MCYWCNKFDMSHTRAAHFTYSHFYTTLLTHHSLVAHLFILTAQTLIIFDRTKNFCAKESITLRFERTIVDGLRLFYLSMRPTENFFWTSKTKLNRLDIFWSLLFAYFNWNQSLHLLFPHLKFLHQFPMLATLL